MKKPFVRRKYRLTDAVLKQKADEIAALVERDREEFADRGYDNDAKVAFAHAIQLVSDQSLDVTLKSSKMIFTSIKRANRTALEKTMRIIFTMAANKFGKNSAKYRAFGEANISKQKDSDIVRSYKMIAIAAQENLAVLTSEGLTQEKIDTLNAQGIALDESIDAVAIGIFDRDIATERRITLLNALYALVIKYARTGKEIFYEISEAKYNDYIIYDTPSGVVPVDTDVPPVQ